MDGKITRDEWDTIMKFMSEGKDSALAVKAGANLPATRRRILERAKAELRRLFGRVAGEARGATRHPRKARAATWDAIVALARCSALVTAATDRSRMDAVSAAE